MKKLIRIGFAALFSAVLGIGAFAETLVAGGEPLGISMQTDGIVVAEVTAIESEGGRAAPAADAGVKKGDIIISLGGTETHTADEFRAALNSLPAGESSMVVLRNGKERTLSVTPAEDENGEIRLGLLLRSEISGTGTLTYYDPASGVFGALGHSISDECAGALPLLSGDIYSAEIVDVVIGKEGSPGELCGNANLSELLGSIELNCGCGIFGEGELPADRVMETAQIKEGSASILCTVSGCEPCEYSVEIEKVSALNGTTLATVCVTDETLLNACGGIVQGMSGSPIIQNGCIVGAVTHVFISDPTRGYGIGIYDMLTAAESISDAA